MALIIPNYHPIIVHFTIALISTSFGTLILARFLTRWKQWQLECLIVSRWCLWLGALASVFTIAAGFHAYFTVGHDGTSHPIMAIHRNWALSTFTLIWLMTIWSWMLWRKAKQPKLLFTLGMIITFGFLLITGWYGAELVFRYGIGVQSLPKHEMVGHHHEGNMDTMDMPSGQDNTTH